MNIKEIVISTTIHINGKYCSVHKITWSGIKSTGSTSCSYNGTIRYAQGNNMSDPPVNYWDYNFCSLFKLNLQLDDKGYPKRCAQCLQAEKVADGD